MATKFTGICSVISIVMLNSMLPVQAAQTSLFDLPEQPKAKSGLGSSFDVPSLGATPGLLEQQNEQKIGEMVLRQIGKEAPLLEDAWTQDELMKVFARVYSNASLGSPVALVVIEDNSINAFAVPGGLFALNTGLILSARTIDEVAGVIGHEVAHVSQRHYSRSKDAFKNQGLLSLAGMLASILIASQGGGDAASAVAIGTQAALIDRQLSYSRNQEREADRIGMYFMSAAGYDPMAMASFFELMNKKTGGVSFLPDFWLTHPLSAERMSEARLRATQFPKPKKSMADRIEDDSFDILKYRVAVLTDQITEARLLSYADRDHGAALALATFYARQGHFDKARSIASRVLQEKPSSIAAITLAEVELKAKQPQQALDVLLPMYKIVPESRALAVHVAKAYMALGQGDIAIQVLSPFSLKNSRDALVWQSMEAAASILPESNNKTIQVLRYRAENQFWRGDMDNAIRSLLRASHLAKDNYALQARIENRLQEMQDARLFKG